MISVNFWDACMRDYDRLTGSPGAGGRAGASAFRHTCGTCACGCACARAGLLQGVGHGGAHHSPLLLGTRLSLSAQLPVLCS